MAALSASKVFQDGVLQMLDNLSDPDVNEKSIRQVNNFLSITSDPTLKTSTECRIGAKSVISPSEFASALAMHLETNIISVGGKGTINYNQIATNIVSPPCYLTEEPVDTPLGVSAISDFIKHNLIPTHDHTKRAYLNYNGVSLLVPIHGNCVVSTPSFLEVSNLYDNALAYTPRLSVSPGGDLIRNPYKNGITKNWMRIFFSVHAFYKAITGYDPPRSTVFAYSKVSLIGSGFVSEAVARFWSACGFPFIFAYDNETIPTAKRTNVTIPTNLRYTVINPYNTLLSKVDLAADYIIIKQADGIYSEVREVIHAMVSRGAKIILNTKLEIPKSGLAINSIKRSIAPGDKITGFGVVDIFINGEDKVKSAKATEAIIGHFRTDPSKVVKLSDKLENYSAFINIICWEDMFTGLDNGKNIEGMTHPTVKVDRNVCLSNMVKLADNSLSNATNSLPSLLLEKKKNYIVSYPIGTAPLVLHTPTDSSFQKGLEFYDHTLVTAPHLRYFPQNVLSNGIMGKCYNTNYLVATDLDLNIDIGLSGKYAGIFFQIMLEMTSEQYHEWRVDTVLEIAAANNIKLLSDDRGFGGHLFNCLFAGTSIPMAEEFTKKNNFPHSASDYQRSYILFATLCHPLKLPFPTLKGMYFDISEDDLKKLLLFSSRHFSWGPNLAKIKKFTHA